jgi:hypothetical protein
LRLRKQVKAEVKVEKRYRAKGLFFEFIGFLGLSLNLSLFNLFEVLKFVIWNFSLPPAPCFLNLYPVESEQFPFYWGQP